MEAKGRNIGQQEIWHHYWIIEIGETFKTFYHDTHNLDGCYDYVMTNLPFNVSKVNSESAQGAGRLPFGLLSINKDKEFGNTNYFWISFF